jgi:hypothetical protein
MKILFNDTPDFLEELSKDKSRIERGIVRINFLTKAAGATGLSSRTLIAQCIVDGHVITLEKFIGEFWPGQEKRNEEIRMKGEEARGELFNRLLRINLEVRGGLISVDKNG